MDCTVTSITFVILDDDRTGAISLENMRRVLDPDGTGATFYNALESPEYLMDLADQDGDSVISMDEWKAFCDTPDAERLLDGFFCMIAGDYDDWEGEEPRITFANLKAATKGAFSDEDIQTFFDNAELWHGGIDSHGWFGGCAW